MRAAGGWAAVIGGALAYDVYLIRRGHRSLSDVAGGRVGRILTLYLAAHLLVRHPRARRIDPLSRAADWVRCVPFPPGR